MKYLFSDWPAISRRLKAASRRLFLFDVDGTLAPIEKTPKAARVQDSLRRLLNSLSAMSGTAVGIISGRQLDDARKMIGLKNLIYAGNHGLEVSINGHRRIPAHARNQVNALKTIYRNARKALSVVRGAFVEWKGLTLSLHYRLVKKGDLALLRRILHESIFPLVARHKLRHRKGKKIIEILPAGAWNKGTVIEMLAKKYHQSVMLFAGDDVTDEGAFGVMRPDDVSIRIGHNKASRARYYLKHQREVEKLLQRLVEL